MYKMSVSYQIESLKTVIENHEKVIKKLKRLKIEKIKQIIRKALKELEIIRINETKNLGETETKITNDAKMKSNNGGNKE